MQRFLARVLDPKSDPRRSIEHRPIAVDLSTVTQTRVERKNEAVPTTERRGDADGRFAFWSAVDRIETHLGDTTMTHWGENGV
jgi:Rieske Fe-S protein